MFFSLFEQKYISISIHQISVISVIVVSESEGQLENLLPELCHLLRAVDQLGKLVTGEQVMGKPLDEIQMKISEKYICQDMRNVNLKNTIFERKKT